ncbi:MAG: hypothetical protein KF785_07885 [Gemmatimonadales bacterium]|nr:hypothetical protein [Gemmatimonadales bacterium]
MTNASPAALGVGFDFAMDAWLPMNRWTRADFRTVLVLAFRHLVVKRGRAALLLFGYAVGAAVMMVLLSVGEAMLIQSRDVRLVGGGEVTLLPEGIDLEGLRTGSMGGMFFGIDRARFLDRQLAGGPRLDDVVAATSPLIEQKLVYLVTDGALHPLRAGGEIPSAAAAVGSALNLLAGRWEDSDADRRFKAPTPSQLLDEIDHFHTPMADSTWAEWHYFNVAPSPDEWWYITFLIGGPLYQGKGGGQLLVTRHREGRPPARYESYAGQDAIRYDTSRADLAIGPHTVTQRDGAYRIQGAAGGVRFDLEIVPERHAYFPPLELRGDRFRSGYVVPVLRGLASGTICEGGVCRAIERAAAYHDHNWGVWRETTWNWGQARGRDLTFVYGGVLTGDSLAAPSSSPYFMAVVDSLGVRQVLRFAAIDYHGARTIIGARGSTAPERFNFRAARLTDTVDVAVTVRHAQATPAAQAGGRIFLQMRGEFTLRGTLLGRPVADSGLGFFETFVAPNADRR